VDVPWIGRAGATGVGIGLGVSKFPEHSLEL
jgi:hypothetical protein